MELVLNTSIWATGLMINFFTLIIIAYVHEYFHLLLVVFAPSMTAT